MAATKKTGRYRVLRDGPFGAAGDLVDLDPDVAALAVRDGMVTPAEEA